MSLLYSIILPAFNEGSRIAPSLEKALVFVREQHWNVEIIVVNDGSRDDTAGIVRSFMRDAPELRLLENPGNRGKGYSVRNGMLNASGDILLFSDVDFSSPIQESIKLLAAIEQGADVAFGSRWLLAESQTQRQSLLRQFVGRAYNLLLRLILGLPYKDTQCGFKAMTGEAAQKIFPRQTIFRWAFDVEILALARRSHLKIAEVPITWVNDDASHVKLAGMINMLWEVLQVRWNLLTNRYK